MKIISLCENTSCTEKIGAEHGLSLYIEANGKRILFDMGQTELFAENAEKLDVDLGAVDVCVLSHGHYDHGGGLGRFLELNGKARVYVTERAFEPHYNGTEKYIGLDVSLSGHPRIRIVKEACNIGEGLTLYPYSAVAEYYPIDSAGLTVLLDGAFVPDKFEHEQYLMIEENGFRTLISGCSHRGVINIVRSFDPDALIGGFHYSKKPTDEGLEAAARELDSYAARYFTCHCTGEAQYSFMKSKMARLNYLSAGQTLMLP